MAGKGTTSGILSVSDPQLRETISPSSGSLRLSPSPSSWEDQLLYFLLPDRFSNGEEDGVLDNAGTPVSGNVKLSTPDDNGNAITTPEDALNWQQNGDTF
jgi:hypothetical protein